MVADWVIMLAISLAINVASYILAPKPKGARPDSVQELEEPTAEAGRPIPVLFGTVELKSPNVLWFGDKSTRRYEIKV